MTSDPLGTARAAQKRVKAAEEKIRPHRRERDEAVRAAFDAGVKPPTIAKATDITLSNVRKILRETAATEADT